MLALLKLDSSMRAALSTPPSCAGPSSTPAHMLCAFSSTLGGLLGLLAPFFGVSPLGGGLIIIIEVQIEPELVVVVVTLPCPLA